MLSDNDKYHPSPLWRFCDGAVYNINVLRQLLHRSRDLLAQLTLSDKIRQDKKTRVY